MEQFYKEIQAVCGGLDFLAGGRFRSIFCNSGTSFQSNTTKNTVKIRIGAQKRVWSAGIDYVSIFPFVMDQMRTFGIFGIFIPILDVGDQFGFSRSKITCFQHFSASAKSCRSAVARNTHRNFVKMRSAIWNEDYGPKGSFRARFWYHPGTASPFPEVVFWWWNGEKRFSQISPMGWTPKRGLKWPKNRFHKFVLQFFFT